EKRQTHQTSRIAIAPWQYDGDGIGQRGNRDQHQGYAEKSAQNTVSFRPVNARDHRHKRQRQRLRTRSTADHGENIAQQPAVAAALHQRRQPFTEHGRAAALLDDAHSAILTYAATGWRPMP